MEKFLNLLRGIVLLCLVPNLYAQNNARTFQEDADDVFSNLNTTYVTSGILYNRSLPNAAINAFPSTQKSNAGHWRQAQSELYNASFNKNNLAPPEGIKTLIENSLFENSIIPIGVILARFEEIVSDAVEMNSNQKLQFKSGYSHSQAFSTEQVAVASVLVPQVPLGTSIFQLPQWAVDNNQNVVITSAMVDFGEGNPVKTFVPGNSTTQVTYNTPGVKDISFTINCSDGSQRAAHATLEVSTNARVGPPRQPGPGHDGVSYVQNMPEIEADIPFQGYDEPTASKGKGNASIFFAVGRAELRKPVIIVDGFDPLDDRGTNSLFYDFLEYSNNGEPQNFGNDLRNDGDDVIVLMDHNCKLWVSFDSPHHGANISISLQTFLEHMANAEGQEGAKDALEKQLNAPAAKQMLIHHHSGTSNEQPGGAPSFRGQFVQMMNSMGFPQDSCLRRVALNNGSKNGTFANSQTGAEALTIQLKLIDFGKTICWLAGNIIGFGWVCNQPRLRSISACRSGKRAISIPERKSRIFKMGTIYPLALLMEGRPTDSSIYLAARSLITPERGITTMSPSI